MSTDGDIEELHKMADRLGLKRIWFQPGDGTHPHYDLTSSKRALAIQFGAKPVSAMEAIERCHPELAEAGRQFAKDFVEMSEIEIVTQETLF